MNTNYYGKNHVLTSRNKVGSPSPIILKAGVSEKLIIVDPNISNATANSLILEETGAGTDTITLQAPVSIPASYTLTLPTDDGTVGQVLTTNGTGNLSWSAGSGGTIQSVNGTANRITISGTSTDPIIDISSSYVGQTSLTTLGAITTGTWNAGQIVSSGMVTATDYFKLKNTDPYTYRLGIPTLADDVILFLPADLGTDGQFLYTDGTGQTGWTNVDGIITLTGTAGRIAISGTSDDPIIDIDINYKGQNTIITVGDITTGTWSGGEIDSSGFVKATDYLQVLKTGQSHYVRLSAPTIATSIDLTLPATDGDPGQPLITDGSGILSFGTDISLSSIRTDRVYQTSTTTAMGINALNKYEILSTGTPTLYNTQGNQVSIGQTGTDIIIVAGSPYIPTISYPPYKGGVLTYRSTSGSLFSALSENLTNTTPITGDLESGYYCDINEDNTFMCFNDVTTTPGGTPGNIAVYNYSGSVWASHSVASGVGPVCKISGDYMVTGQYDGSLNVLLRSGTSWNLQQTIVSAGSAVLVNLFDIINQNQLTYYLAGGNVTTYTRSGTTWSQVATFTPAATVTNLATCGTSPIVLAYTTSTNLTILTNGGTPVSYSTTSATALTTNGTYVFVATNTTITIRKYVSAGNYPAEVNVTSVGGITSMACNSNRLVLGRPAVGSYGECDVFTINPSFTDGTVTVNEIKLFDAGNLDLQLTSNYGIYKVNADIINLTGTTLTNFSSVINLTANTINLIGPTVGTSTITGSRLISNVSTGTAPLTVTSTTLVTNLAANYLSQTNITSSDSTTYYPMFSLNASTVSSVISTSRLSFVASTGIMSVPRLNVFDSTDSTSSSTGCIVTTGGIGCAKAITSGGKVYIKGVTNTDGESLSISSAYPNATITSYQDTANPHYVLTCRNTNGLVGAIYTTGSATVYAVASDRKLKTGLKDPKLGSSLGRINSVKLYDYRWKSDNKVGFGPVADELKEVFPELVIEPPNKDDPLLVNYYGLIPYLVNCIQELSERIIELEKN